MHALRKIIVLFLIFSSHTSFSQNLLDGTFIKTIPTDSPDSAIPNAIQSKDGALRLKHWKVANQSKPYFEEFPEGRCLKVALSKQILEQGKKTKYLEFVQADFSQPLEKDIWYKLEFEMKTTEESNMGIMDIPVFFGKKALPKQLPSNVPLPEIPQLKATNIITPPNLFDYHKNWQKVEKYYQATDEEQFLIFGYFKNHGSGFTNLSGKILGTKGNLANVTYFFRNFSLTKVPPPEGVGTSATSEKPDHVTDLYDLKTSNIYFQTGEYFIDDEGKNVLDNLYAQLERHPELTLLIEGHTDETGSEEGNRILSENRAKAARDYLAQKGIKKERLIQQGKGSRRPIASNSSAMDRQRNRRVSFYFQFPDLDSDQLEILRAFSKIYGYLRFFYPGQRAQEVDWNAFAAYGVKQIMTSPNEDVAQLFRQLFMPIAPEMFICNLKGSPCASAKPDKVKPGTDYWSWQHNGLKSDMNPAFNSARVKWRIDKKSTERKLILSDSKLFETLPYPNQSIQEIFEKLQIKISIPLIIPAEESIPPASFIAFKKKFEQATFEKRYKRIASSMVVWNTVQHFFPYREKLNLNWEAEHQDIINAVARAIEEKDYEIAMKKLVAKLQDGHAKFVHKSHSSKMFPSVQFKWVEGELVIANPFQNKDLERGDKVLLVDDNDAKVLFNQDTTLISGSPQWKISKAAEEFATGDYGSALKLAVERNGKIITTEVQRVWGEEGTPPEPVQEIEPGIYYLQLLFLPPDSLPGLLPKLQTAKGIIIDARGYPPIGGKHVEFLEHILSVSDTTKWIYSPQIVYPNQEHQQFEIVGWEMKPKADRLNTEAVFLTDGSALSACESFLGMVKHYNLGPIIGGPTAGANGGANRIHLLDDYRFYWTGEYVTLPDGTYYHGIGIQPDIFCEPSLKSIEEGRDVLLERALLEVKK